MKLAENNSKTLEQQIEIINEDIKELKYNQINELILLNKNHITYMKKLQKLEEFTKIQDMSNQLIEKRLHVIEGALKDISKSISA